ncbi:MAG: DUF349 domain-containing protein [Bacteroidales bacterium]|nr:DUF349 domain-containing protein [Bacteroidales bacterium]MBN2761579.1 DUF349 domain-containing protein [Bacteroidales bacterium]
MKSTNKKATTEQNKEALPSIDASEDLQTSAEESATEKKPEEEDKTTSPDDKAEILHGESDADTKITQSDGVPDEGYVNGREPSPGIQESLSSSEENREEDDKAAEKKDEQIEDGPEKIQFAALSMEDLVALLKDFIHKKAINEIINDVENIKINFYKKHKANIEKKRKNFIEAGGELEDFLPEEDPLEKELKELLKIFKDQKAEYTKVLEEQKQKNLEEKYRIIEGIKELSNKQESINKTFQEFRELQRQWRSIGPVPQGKVKNLWDNYHHHVEAFYDYIKINQELRDLDLKKNLEAKLVLCEKAEGLLLETNIMSAFKTLQEYHEQWREIGPVPPDMRTEIWDRFKEATAKINKKHQDYFVNLKTEQRKNLEAKVMLCEKAEEINDQEISTNKDWNRLSNEMIGLQKIWKTIGFAPKKDNNKIYLRFRTACDTFFNRKREFYSTIKEEQNNNLQLKTDLCVQAESLQDSEEWKKTTEELIALQQRWKEIGPVPFKVSDKIWKRFRSACDSFFERKSKHYADVDDSFESNLQKKADLLHEIEEYQVTDNAEESLKKLKEFQRKWAEIGFVPIKMKEEILEKYRAAINMKFDELKIDDRRKNLLKFKTKLENIMDRPNSGQRIRQEREKYISRLKQLENDIVLWENNIGFFTKSKNAESMIKEVETRIEEAKKTIELLSKKIGMIDDIED